MSDGEASEDVVAGPAPFVAEDAGPQSEQFGAVFSNGGVLGVGGADHRQRQAGQAVLQIFRDPQEGGGDPDGKGAGVVGDQVGMVGSGQGVEEFGAGAGDEGLPALCGRAGQQGGEDRPQPLVGGAVAVEQVAAFGREEVVGVAQAAEPLSGVGKPAHVVGQAAVGQSLSRLGCTGDHPGDEAAGQDDLLSGCLLAQFPEGRVRVPEHGITGHQPGVRACPRDRARSYRRAEGHHEEGRFPSSVGRGPGGQAGVRTTGRASTPRTVAVVSLCRTGPEANSMARVRASSRPRARDASSLARGAPRQ